MSRGPDPPQHLSEATKAWWRIVIQDFDLSPHQILLLRMSCEAWDRSKATRQLVVSEDDKGTGGAGSDARPPRRR